MYFWLISVVWELVITNTTTVKLAIIWQEIWTLKTSERIEIKSIFFYLKDIDKLDIVFVIKSLCVKRKICYRCPKFHPLLHRNWKKCPNLENILWIYTEIPF